jgi:hypothetical protein
MNVFEAYPTIHFRERIDRFGPLTKPSFDISKISKKIGFLYNFTFPEKTIVGVLIYKSKITYKAPAKLGERPSVGNEIWAVIDDNKLITIFFSDDGRKKVSAEMFINIDKLITYASENGVMKISRKELQSLIRQITQRIPEPQNKPRLNLPTMKISGEDWYIDYENEMIISVSNTDKKMSFDSAFESLPEHELEGIMAQI